MNTNSVKTEVREFIDAWGKAWSPKENAAGFTRASIAPFYLQSDELLAFDFTDAQSQTVFQGVQIHHDTWEAFVRDYNYWTFTPVTESIRVYPQSNKAATATLYVDNYGKKTDATEFEARAHTTLVLEKQDSNWVIVHENIWGPVNEKVESEEQTIRRLSQEWIEQGFSPKQDTKNYTYEKYFAPYYNATAGAVVLHDNNDPQMRIQTDAKAYHRIWEKLFANLDYLGNKLTSFYQVEVEGDLAFSSFTADAIVESKGEKTVMPVFYTLVWRKTTDGWRIIHEHGSNLTTEDSPVR